MTCHCRPLTPVGLNSSPETSDLNKIGAAKPHICVPSVGPSVIVGNVISRNPVTGGALCLSAAVLMAVVFTPIDGRASESWKWFTAEVQPILEKHCAECHSGDKRKGGFSMNTRETILEGSETEEVVLAGKPDESFLIELVRETDPDFRMPPEEKDPLTPEEVAVLEKWIADDLIWPEGYTLGRVARRAPLAPRKVPLPESDRFTNPIDRLLEPYLDEHQAELNPPTSDHRWIRKAWLDAVGLLPPPDALDTFFDGQTMDRDAAADHLLGRNEAYAAHWMTYWNDWLRNDYRGTGFIDGGRRQITEWLFEALYTNKPYDRFVTELLTEAPGAEGFLHGIKWRGTVNDSQRREMQAAQSISQVFLGTNLKCASCHDSFVNDWKLKEAYAFASVFSDEPLELHRCNKPLGKHIEPSFLYPELGGISPELERESRLNRLASLITSPDNGRLSRTIVNRLWAHFFGRGIIADVDDMDQPPFSDDLLDWLASDLASNGYDLKRTIKWILTSDAYRAAPSPAGDGADQWIFTGPVSRRMSAEQFLDAVSQLTGAPLEAGDASMKVDGRGQGGQLQAIGRTLATASGNPQNPASAATGASWVWTSAKAHQSAAAGESFTASVKFVPEDGFTRATLVAVADNSITVSLNGTRIASSTEWTSPISTQVSGFTNGSNTLAFTASNGGESANPAGAIVCLTLTDAQGGIIQTVSTGQPGWRVEGGGTLHTLGEADMGPWNIGDKLSGVPTWVMPERIRASYLFSDELTRAMGRPSREQIVTRRDPYATTLELLELTNGQTLDSMLRDGASRWRDEFDASPHRAVNRLFQTALCRPASPAEMQTAFELTGPQAGETGIQDLLWIVSMLPEFQVMD